MTIYRFTTPVVRTEDHAEIDTITYSPGSGALEVSFVTKDPTGNAVSFARVTVSPIPGPAQTRLNELVTRLYTYLNTQGRIPNGTEE